ncbi:MAG: hypothetical protein IPP51_01275 [Bacteroidetes bacterium]|nr:hypothetical protein [Bacteroidota bacterium]
MRPEFQRWLRIGIVNLVIVVFLGVILRYKIAFALPFVDQKNLLQGHSHFAFAGWITQVLMTLLVLYLDGHGVENALKKYKWILTANLATAYGMLISFPIEGYATISIIFSTLSIFVSYAFAILFCRDLKKVKGDLVSKLWLRVAVIFNALSSLGAFSLAYMMATHVMHEKFYLAAIYFFLHFQYNGWFFFAVIGLWISKLETYGIKSDSLRKSFWLFFLAAMPAYFLSVLWLKIPVWMYLIIVISALVQVVGWWKIVRVVMESKSQLRNEISLAAGRLFKLSALALTIKLLLQVGSTYPSLSQLAFGFRPIVIGYLHLVLLGVITLFLIAWIVTENGIVLNLTSIRGIAVFAVGIIINEFFLMFQGVCGMKTINVPGINEMLFVTALILFGGVLMLLVGQFQFRKSVFK